MKSTSIKLLFLILLFSLSFMFTSCGYVGVGIEIGNNTNSYKEATDYLCSRVWIDEWTDAEGNTYRQELRFDYNNVGQDYMMMADRRGNVQEYTNSFVWDWFSVDYTSLRLKYTSGGVSYMDNMRMGNNRIECLFDREPAYFYGR